MWTAQTAVLAGAVAVDLPGHPDGDPLGDVADLAERVARAIATIPGPRALIGHSLGGAVAIEVARARPDLVDGVVVIAAGARLPVPDAALARVREDFDAEVARLIEGSFADAAVTMADVARAALASCGPETLHADYTACRSVDLRGGLDAVRVPVLVIAGTDDPFTPLRHNEALARELPMGRLIVVPGGRHLLHAEYDVTVNQLIAAYLARLELTLADA